mgnify:CR=1 FL=1
MITGLDIGADDYIAKPYSLRNVKARIEAVLRRTGIKGSCNGVKCDRDTLVCTVDNKEVRLPRKARAINVSLISLTGLVTWDAAESAVNPHLKSSIIPELNVCSCESRRIVLNSFSR